MNRIFGIMVCVFFVAAGSAGAASRVVQLSLCHPLQLVPRQENVDGVSLNIFYVENKDVSGFSISAPGVNRVTGDFHGVQWGGVNWVDGHAQGWQAGLLNHTGGNFIGWQAGLVNKVKGEAIGLGLGLINMTDGPMTGMQAGLSNYAAEVHGVQCGIINVTRSLDGVQIGLGNYNGKKEPFGFLPIINGSF